MSEQAIAQAKPQSTTKLASVSHGILQRCSNGVECEECRKKREGMLQRSAVNAAPTHDVPPIVHEALRSPGKPLDAVTQEFMGSRFGQDFSSVRVHIGAHASESAHAINARAYTVGQDVVFGAGQYTPDTMAGKMLLAHELTHTVQQRAATVPMRSGLELGATDTWQEREAESISRNILTMPAPSSRGSFSHGTAPGIVQRDPQVPGQPGPPMQGGINLSIDERGKVDITLFGPENTPVVPKPTIGIRRDPDGKYHLLVGGKDKVVTVDQIPEMLRQAMGQKKGATPVPGKLRVPTCSQLMLPSGRFMRFDEYKVSQMISTDLMPLTPELYDALIDLCRTQLSSKTSAEPAKGNAGSQQKGTQPPATLPQHETRPNVGRGGSRVDADLDRPQSLLSVKMKVKFNFVNIPMAWPKQDDKTHFQNDFVSLVSKRWSNKYLLVPDGPCPNETAKAVQVHVQALPVTSSQHFTFTVGYTNKFRTSSVSGRTALLDSLDTAERSDIPQTPVEHEFGHMLGLPHIHCDNNSDACYGVSDEEKADIMGKGSEVSKRDYEVFAEIMNIIDGCKWKPGDAPGHAGLGALIGGVLLGGIGALVGGLLGGLGGALIGGLIGAAAGAGLGALIGGNV